MDNNFYKILQTFKQLNEATSTTTASTLDEGALDELYGELGDKYDELAPGIEKYKDEAGADRLYKELENIAQQHGLSREFKRMCNGAQHRAHLDYDTNPGHFKNWFWYLPFAKDMTEGSMSNVEKRPTGPKFGGYLKGTDPAPKAGDNKAFGSCEEDSTEPTKHQVIVTISDPDSPAVTQRKETRQRKCTVTARNQDGAVNAALAFYKRQGYKVHDHHYVGPVDALQEYGTTTGGITGMTGGNMAMSTNDPVEKQAAAKELSALTAATNKAKQAGVLPQNASTTPTAQAIQADPQDLAHATPQQKKEMGAAAAGFNEFMKSASQTAAGQSALNSVLQKMKQTKINPGA
jgi:hypothetical protein